MEISLFKGLWEIYIVIVFNYYIFLEVLYRTYYCLWTSNSWDLSIPLTLQSRWRVRSVSIQNTMTWISLFSMQFLKNFEVYLPFTLSYQTKIFLLYVISSVVERSHTFALAKVNVSQIHSTYVSYCF